MISEFKNLSLGSFLDLCQKPEETQASVLKNIILEHASTELGRKLGLDKIRTTSDFAEKIPIGEWESFEPFTEKCRRGDVNVMFQGKPSLFIITSGTTGESKLFPESEDAVNIKRNIANIRFEAITKICPGAFSGKLFPVANSGVFGYTEQGIPYGSASGVTLNTASEKWLDLLAFPIEVMDETEPDALDYLRMRFALENDVSIIIGNNAARIKQLFELVNNNFSGIVESIENGVVGNVKISESLSSVLNKKLKPNPDRAIFLKNQYKKLKKITPLLYWPNLKIVSCWLAGSVGRYAVDLRNELSENVMLWDCGFGATEAKFNIPLRNDDPSGPLAIHSAYFEFFDPADPEKILMTHELEKDGVYEILCTTYSGLYRYRMHDLVRVTGFCENTPELKFETKTGDVINICGEKISAHILMDAVLKASGENEIELTAWCVAPDYADNRYLFCVELKNNIQIDRKSMDFFAEAIQKNLCANDILPYGLFCRQGLLQPAKIVLMKNGWARQWLNLFQKNKGLGPEQIKLPVCVESVPIPELTLEVVCYASQQERNTDFRGFGFAK